jgi:hypothetical protein
VGHRDLGEDSLEATHPHIAEQWDPDLNGSLTPRHVRAESSDPVWWRCPLGDPYDEAPGARTRRGRGCPFCAGKRVNERNCLETVSPFLAGELAETNEFTAREVYGGGHRRVDWRCSADGCGHLWSTEMRQRTHLATRCPECKGVGRRGVGQQPDGNQERRPPAP